MGILSDLFGGGKKRDSSGEAAVEEERRKADLRRRIDRLYGIESSEALPSQPISLPGWLGGKLKERLAGLQPQIDARNAAGASEAGAARSALEAEKTKLADATRSFYTDQLSRDFEKASRNAKFNLARRGVLGGSADVDLMSELEADRNLGATRVDEAVRRAIAGLDTSREQERLNAISLVNSGAGDSAVSAAQRGLQNAFANQSSAQKTNLTSDLFSVGADAMAFQNLNDQEAARVALIKQRTSPFFTSRSTSGRVTPSA